MLNILWILAKVCVYAMIERIITMIILYFIQFILESKINTDALILMFTCVVSVYNK